MQAALSQVCSLDSTFANDVEQYAAAKCGAIEVWLTKLETFLESHSIDEARNLLAEHQMVAPVASFQGGLLVSQGQQREEAWSHFRRRLALCRAIDAGTLVVACDVPGSVGQVDIDRVRASLKLAADEAIQHDVRIALEFQCRSAFGNNLQTAAALVEEAASPNLGICFDAFHWYVGPSKESDLGLVSRENLFHVQLSDVADVPRELATDSHRILPGEGDIPLEPVIARLRQISYDGCVSLELMNPVIWRVGPLSLGEIGMTCLRRLLGQAGS